MSVQLAHETALRLLVELVAIHRRLGALEHEIATTGRGSASPPQVWTMPCGRFGSADEPSWTAFRERRFLRRIRWTFIPASDDFLTLVASTGGDSLQIRATSDGVREILLAVLDTTLIGLRNDRPIHATISFPWSPEDLSAEEREGRALWFWSSEEAPFEELG